MIQAGAIAKGGEIFVLDMGEPVKIVDLAQDLIRLSGFEPEAEIKIEYIGARPGEKMFEELFLADEGALRKTHEKIFVEKPLDLDCEKVLAIISGLNGAMADTEGLKRRIFSIVDLANGPERCADVHA